MPHQVGRDHWCLFFGVYGMNEYERKKRSEVTPDFVHSLDGNMLTVWRLCMMLLVWYMGWDSVTEI